MEQARHPVRLSHPGQLVPLVLWPLQPLMLLQLHLPIMKKMGVMLVAAGVVL